MLISLKVKMLLMGGSRAAATFKMEGFVIIVNGALCDNSRYHEAFHLGCCRSPRSASATARKHSVKAT